MTHSSNIWQKGDETPYFNGLLCHRINFKRYKPHTYFRWCQILKCQIYFWEYIHWTLLLNEPQHTGGPVETIWSPTPLPSSPDFPKPDGYIVSAACCLSSNWIFALKSDKIWDGEDLEIHYNPWSGDQMRVLPSFSHLDLLLLSSVSEPAKWWGPWKCHWKYAMETISLLSETVRYMFGNHRLVGMGRGYPSEAGLSNSTSSPTCFLRKETLVHNRAFVFHAWGLS